MASSILLQIYSEAGLDMIKFFSLYAPIPIFKKINFPIRLQIKSLKKNPIKSRSSIRSKSTPSKKKTIFYENFLFLFVKTTSIYVLLNIFTHLVSKKSFRTHETIFRNAELNVFPTQKMARIEWKFEWMILIVLLSFFLSDR